MLRAVGLKSNSATVFTMAHTMTTCVPVPMQHPCVCVSANVCVLRPPHVKSSYRASWAGNKARAMPTMLSLSSFSLQLKVGNFSCLAYLDGTFTASATAVAVSTTAAAAPIAIMQIRMADYQITNCNGSNCFVYGWHMACQRQVGRQLSQQTKNKRKILLNAVKGRHEAKLSQVHFAKHMPHATCDMQHATCNIRRAKCNTSSCHTQREGHFAH